MNTHKKKKLESRGWRTGSVQDLLELTDAEMAYIELKLMLGEQFKKRRQKQNLTQVEAAKLLHSNQSRVAKMEAGDPSVSLDLLIRALLTLGTSTTDLAKMIAARKQQVIAT